MMVQHSSTKFPHSCNTTGHIYDCTPTKLRDVSKMHWLNVEASTPRNNATFALLPTRQHRCTSMVHETLAQSEEVAAASVILRSTELWQIYSAESIAIGRVESRDFLSVARFCCFRPRLLLCSCILVSRPADPNEYPKKS